MTKSKQNKSVNHLLVQEVAEQMVATHMKPWSELVICRRQNELSWIAVWNVWGGWLLAGNFIPSLINDTYPMELENFGWKCLVIDQRIR